MKMQIGRWGNSLAVRLPRSLVERFGLREGDEIDSAVLENVLETVDQKDVELRRREALQRIRDTKWALPEGWKFDREEAHERGPL
ncbi:MAG: AbrB/MazE/SpoVT family DNA-binding domain-containing protein [Allosphingosinicella sp.]|uniref:AbrB/MazE/SpoVT family DNA-binding domain-containing protein n=1 Tax=Allosphingosinicella sp. TaxID=2823234 RepID=UPI003946E5FB